MVQLCNRNQTFLPPVNPSNRVIMPQGWLHHGREILKKGATFMKHSISLTLSLALSVANVAAQGSVTINYGGTVVLTSALHYSAGQDAPDIYSVSPVVTLVTKGAIESVSLTPFMNITMPVDNGDGTWSTATLPDTLNFEFYVRGHGHFPGFFATSGLQSMTLTPEQFLGYQFGQNPDHTGIDLCVAGDFGEQAYFANYRLEHLNQDLTFRFGIAIDSLTYSAVPEPSETVLMLVGAIALVAMGKLRV